MPMEIEEHRRLKGTVGSFPSAEVVAGKYKTMMEILLDLQTTDPQYYTDETIRSLMLVREYQTHDLYGFFLYMKIH